MIFIFICLLLGLCQISAEKRSTLIIGGSNTTNGGRPFNCMIHAGIYICSGIWIANKTALTAAHCLYNTDGSQIPVSSVYITSGTYTSPSVTSNGPKSFVSKYIILPGYNPPNNGVPNDLALVIVNQTFTHSTNAQTIGLATSDPTVGSTCIVSGWGATSGSSGTASTPLKQVSVSIDQQSVCNNEFGFNLASTQICAGSSNTGACYGDSGGPLTCGATLLAGVVSAGAYNCEGPQVYTSVAKNIAWINANKVN